MAETRERTDEGQPEGHGEGVCPVGFCPIGMFLTVAGEARPEAVEHLLNAGRELVLAAAAVLDARAEGLQRKPDLERIELE